MWHFDPTMHLMGKSICNEISSTRESGHCSFSLCLSGPLPSHPHPTLPGMGAGCNRVPGSRILQCPPPPPSPKIRTPAPGMDSSARAKLFKPSRRLPAKHFALCNLNSKKKKKRCNSKKLHFVISIYEYWYSWVIIFFPLLLHKLSWDVKNCS